MRRWLCLWETSKLPVSVSIIQLTITAVKRSMKTAPCQEPMKTGIFPTSASPSSSTIRISPESK